MIFNFQNSNQTLKQSLPKFETLKTCNVYEFLSSSKYQDLNPRMTQLFEIQTIEGKGVGFVATKDIKRGTVIFTESPQLDLALEEKGKIYVRIYG